MTENTVGHPANNIARSAGSMGVATFISRIMGLLREQVFAHLFGASNAADAFNIAFRIPNLLRDLFAEGAMSAAFVPNFTKSLMKSKVVRLATDTTVACRATDTTEAFKLLAAVLWILLLSTTVLSLIAMFFAHDLVALYAGAFKSIPEKFELTVSMTRMMIPFFPMVALAAVTMGALNALGSFFLPAFAPVMFNIASVLCGLFLTPIIVKHTSWPPIYSMSIAVLIGGFLQFAIQWWQIRKMGFTLKQNKDVFTSPFKVDGVKPVLWLLIPGTLGLAATQLNILINSIYATSQGAGAVSWLNYAFRLIQFPIGIFGVSLAVATLPAVSRHLAQGHTKDASLELNSSLRLNYAINAPAAAGLIAAGLPIVQVLFEHGKFTNFDAHQTYAALFCYALGLPGYSMVKVMVPIFYALKQTRIPVTASFFAVGLNLFLNAIFLNTFHFPFWALALATSITSTLNALVLGLFLAKKLPGSIRLFKSIALHTLLALLVGGVAHQSAQLVGSQSDVLFRVFGFIGKIMLWSGQVVAAILSALIVWLGIGKLLGVEEILGILSLASRRPKKCQIVKKLFGDST